MAAALKLQLAILDIRRNHKSQSGSISYFSEQNFLKGPLNDLLMIYDLSASIVVL